MNLSKHLTLSEATKSATAIRRGIHNIPPDFHLAALVNIAENVFEPIRVNFDVPIGISSGYRSNDLNEAIGGSKTSQHSRGEALDLDADMYGGVTNKEIFDFIKDNLEFDQLIWEYGTDNEPNWIHVSLKYKGKQRGQVLKASRSNGKTVYTTI